MTIKQIENRIKTLHYNRRNKYQSEVSAVKKAIARYNGKEYDYLMAILNRELLHIYCERRLGYNVLGGQTISEVVDKIKSNYIKPKFKIV